MIKNSKVHTQERTARNQCDLSYPFLRTERDPAAANAFGIDV